MNPRRTASIARHTLLALSLALPSTLVSAAPEKPAVIETFADIAEAMYQNSLTLARELQTAIDELIAQPGEASLQAAREAWLAARVPYQQTEVYRFGNAIVDDWEGRVNAWPLDEGLIDYVDASYGRDSEDNPLYTANVIASATLEYGAEPIDASEIDRALLDDTLHEIGGVEANVTIGYHAIEFLFWGQDLNGTGPGKGERPWTDYATGEQCSNGHCERRARYLEVAVGLLVDDLNWMTEQWGTDGEARQALTENAVIQAAIDALTTQTRSIERIVAALSLQSIRFEGSDSLDAPAAVFGG